MPRNGSGSYSLPQPPFIPNTTISSSAVNADLADIAAALTNSVAADGQTVITGSLQGNGTGTQAQPSYAFSGALGSGFYPNPDGSIGVSVAGSTVATFTPGGVIAAGTPVGMVVDFAGTTAPPKWLLCFGQQVSRTTYALLFAAIGTTFGGGDGVNTFNVPDLRGRATFGQDNMGGTPANRITAGVGNYNGSILGNSGGLQTHQQSTAELAPHTHTLHTSFNDPGHFHTIPISGNTGLSGIAAEGSAQTTSMNTDNKQTGITFAVSMDSAGGNIPFTILNPSLILNKIIFAGA